MGELRGKKEKREEVNDAIVLNIEEIIFKQRKAERANQSQTCMY